MRRLFLYITFLMYIVLNAKAQTPFDLFAPDVSRPMLQLEPETLKDTVSGKTISNLQQEQIKDDIRKWLSVDPLADKYPNISPYAYCGWNHYNFRVTTDGIGYGTLSSTKYVPATKEQRNLLFQKMKKAGYWWDVDKKKLKLLISNGSDFESDDSEQESKEEIKTTAYGTFGNNGAIEYVYILDYCSGRVIVAKRDTEESIETLFDKLGLKESQSQYMVSTDILSIEYINF